MGDGIQVGKCSQVGAVMSVNTLLGSGILVGNVIQQK